MDSGAMEPGSSKPLGTRQELEKLGLNLLRNASCSQPTSRNVGCRHYPCKALMMLRAKGWMAPEFVVYQQVKPNGKVKQDAELCSDYMDTKHNAHPALGRWRIIGFGGHATIKAFESAPNPKDKTNRSRIRGLVPFVVPAFPRPGASREDLVNAIELRKDLEERMKIEAMEEAAGVSIEDPTTRLDAGLESDDDPETTGPDELSGEDELDDLAEEEPAVVRQLSAKTARRAPGPRRKAATEA